jgi:hypothetical protein
MNAFLDLADRQISGPCKARHRAAEKRAARKAADDRDQLRRARQLSREERLQTLLASPHAPAARALIDFLEAMTLDQGAALIALIAAGPWIAADADTRFLVLALIDRAIVALRERCGLEAFNDALPDERASVFQIIREALQ